MKYRTEHVSNGHCQEWLPWDAVAYHGYQQYLLTGEYKARACPLNAPDLQTSKHDDR
jgi:hypothetical protein